MSPTNKKPVQPVKKPFLRGGVTDEHTPKSALGFFGLLLVIVFMSFLVCSVTGLDSAVLRYVINIGIIALLLMIFAQRGAGVGTEAVARGETMYQRKEKGLAVTAAEEKTCYHPLKGFVTALIGTLPFFLLALILALTAEKQITGYGTLPSWVDVYARRSEVGGALVAYTTSSNMSFQDILRVIVRISMMPWVSMVQTQNRDAMLLLERLSPLIMLLPAIAYGIGYTQGVRVRTQVHTEIAENKKRKARQEKRKKKSTLGSLKPKGPQQLN